MSDRWASLRTSLARDGHSQEFIEQEVVAMNVISWLNDQGRTWGGMFDGGEMGVLHVWWHRHSWEHKWYDLEQMIGQKLQEWEDKMILRDTQPAPGGEDRVEGLPLPGRELRCDWCHMAYPVKYRVSSWHGSHLGVVYQFCCAECLSLWAEASDKDDA